MSLNRYAARTDANQAEIIRAMEAAGCSVEVIGWPVDLAVGRNATTMLMEVKDGRKPPSQRKLTKSQLAFIARWKGGPVAVVTDVESALRAVEMMSERSQCQYPDCTENEDERCSRWLSGECAGPAR